MSKATLAFMGLVFFCSLLVIGGLIAVTPWLGLLVFAMWMIFLATTYLENR